MGGSFGLDPLNRSSALLDEDFDGWDENYDGILSPDVSHTDTALAIGEQLSNIEEYKVYYDEGNDVIAGLKSIEFDTDSSTLFNFPISFAVTEEELSIMHHDVRSLNVVDSTIYATTKYGVTIIDYSAQSSIDYWMPQE